MNAYFIVSFYPLETRKNQKKRSRKKPLTFEELGEEFANIVGSSSTLEPLPCVIISVGYLEQFLYTLLSAFLIEGSTSERLLDFNGPIGSLKAKADLAYSLGLIPKTLFQNLSVIGEIRNVFAHSHSHIPLSFDSEQIAELIDGVAGEDSKPGLTIPAVYKTISEDGIVTTITTSSWHHNDRRKTFQASIYLAMNILGSRENITRRPKCPED